MTKQTLPAMICFCVWLSCASLVFAEREFNVAIGVVQATGEDPDPGFFDVLQNSALRPAGWQFVNPHNNVSGNYWKTNLAALSVQQLLDYDLVLITNHQATPFTPEENAKIQQWVSQGGIIWIDDCGDMAPQNFFLQFDFASYDGEAYSGYKGTDLPGHRFFNNPAVYVLLQDELANLGHPGYSAHVINYIPAEWTEILYNQSSGQRLPDMLLRQYDAGLVIVSADDYGCAVNDYADPEDIKFSYNILDWAQTVPEPSTTSMLGAVVVCMLLGWARRSRRQRATCASVVSNP